MRARCRLTAVSRRLRKQQWTFPKLSQDHRASGAPPEANTDEIGHAGGAAMWPTGSRALAGRGGVPASGGRVLLPGSGAFPCASTPFVARALVFSTRDVGHVRSWARERPRAPGAGWSSAALPAQMRDSQGTQHRNGIIFVNEGEGLVVPAVLYTLRTAQKKQLTTHFAHQPQRRPRHDIATRASSESSEGAASSSKAAQSGEQKGSIRSSDYSVKAPFA